jgi:hypothetical protein
MWRKQIKEDYKNKKKSSCNFSRPNCTPLCPKIKKIQIQGQIKLLLDEFA